MIYKGGSHGNPSFYWWLSILYLSATICRSLRRSPVSKFPGRYIQGKTGQHPILQEILKAVMRSASHCLQQPALPRTSYTPRRFGRSLPCNAGKNFSHGWSARHTQRTAQPVPQLLYRNFYSTFMPPSVNVDGPKRDLHGSLDFPLSNGAYVPWPQQYYENRKRARGFR
jgi:hypothetical protein